MSDTDSIGLSRLAYVFHRVRPSQLMPHVDAINAAAVEAQINTVDRWSMWLAQLGHESEQFTVFEERLSYSAEALLKTWPTHFDAAAAQGYQHQTERIANRAYAGRLGNGDEESGDGWKYRGRGAIQLTGFSNYLACGVYLGVDLVGHPEYAAGLDRFRVAAWFWRTHGLNHWADTRNVEDATKAINGGLNGLAERKELFERAQDVLSPAGGSP